MSSRDLYRLCEYASTLSNAVFDIVEGMVVRLIIKNIRRCLDKRSILSDLNSKGNVAGAKEI